MPVDEPLNPSAPPPPLSPEPPPPIPARSRNVGMLVLCYLWVFALVPFLSEQVDPEVRWHSRHGLVLLGAEIVVWAGLIFTSLILPFLVVLFPLFFVAVVVLHVLEVMKALNGERLPLRGISEYADKL